MNLTDHHAEYLTRELIHRAVAGTVEGVVNVLANVRVGPKMVALVARAAGKSRQLGYGSWGLIPHWQKARTTRVSGLFNARAETVATLPSFRDAFRTGRVLVPIDAFYEWENPEHLAELGRPIGKREPKQRWAYLILRQN